MNQCQWDAYPTVACWHDAQRLHSNIIRNRFVDAVDFVLLKNPVENSTYNKTTIVVWTSMIQRVFAQQV